MKSTLTTLGVSFGFLLVSALSMGNRMYLLLALVIIIAWVLAYISIRMAEKNGPCFTRAEQYPCQPRGKALPCRFLCPTEACYPLRRSS